MQSSPETGAKDKQTLSQQPSLLAKLHFQSTSMAEPRQNYYLNISHNKGI